MKQIKYISPIATIEEIEISENFLDDSDYENVPSLKAPNEGDNDDFPWV